MILHHAVFHPEPMLDALRPQARRPFALTILREPRTQIVSAYDFFSQYPSFAALPAKSTSGHLTYFGALNSTWQDPFNFGRFRNPQSHDLGWYQRHGGSAAFDDDGARIASWLALLTSSLDLVMILEHMDASLVLLARALGCPLAMIGSYSCAKNVFGGEHTRLTAEEHRLVRRLHGVDRALYRHFLRRLLPLLPYLRADVQQLRRARCSSHMCGFCESQSRRVVPIDPLEI